MTWRQRWAALALLGVLGVAVAHWPQQAAAWQAEVWPGLRRWPNLNAQFALAEPAVHAWLADAARQMPAETTVLLVTPGDDWRRADYVVYHRALYWLTPRPVVWAMPPAADGTWEGRWHYPTALNPAALAARAQAFGIECLLAWDVPAANLPGQVVWAGAGGTLVALAAPAACAGPAELPPPAPPPWVAIARAGLGVVVILALGAAGLPLLARLGLPLGGPEAAAVAWLIGAAVVSTALLWLSALRVPLSTQVVGLSIAGVAAGVGSWMKRRPAARPVTIAAEPPAGRRRWLNAALVAMIAVQAAVVLATAVGRPLMVWDSWVNWGLKARLIYSEQGGLPAVYADPTRLITHPDYPLLVPLLQAWLYAWVGAADDRWAGLPGALFYLAALVGLHASLRRQGVGATWARVAAAATAGLPALAGLTGAAYPDAVVAGLAALAAVYLLEWARRGTSASLALAALAAGLLPWVKREGLVLALILLAAALLVARRQPPPGPRRARRVLLTYLAALLVLAGPWYVFTAAARVPNPDYGPVTAGVYLAQVERLLYVGWRGLRVLVEPRLGLIAPLAALAAGLSVRGRGGGPAVSAAGLVGLGVPLVYLGVVAQGYVFSNYAPFEQHVINSLERLALHVAVLPLLWLALRTAPGDARP